MHTSLQKYHEAQNAHKVLALSPILGALIHSNACRDLEDAAHICLSVQILTKAKRISRMQFLRYSDKVDWLL